ncbi:DUF6220 domain-containing protein [Natronosalvus caseinilyticus]|uniref:DUF6220 domain-containing protein n=1 Tax=Natronosalvus caseinilyticus TaxID=2953747 RepID=UPI0028AC951B|nr:DUF6220 domain-containing protein [Natronosalvus caseinilyticus]
MAEPKRVVWARYGFFVLASFFVLCVLVQVYIAGMAVFVDPTNWSLHRTFVHVFEPVVFLLFPLAFLGRLSAFLKAVPVVLFVLVSAQYATAHLYGSLVAAIHSVNAVVIVFVAAMAVRRTWAQIQADR